MGLEFSTQGLEWVTAPTQEEAKAQGFGFPSFFPMHPDPQGQFGCIWIESIGQKEVQMSPHASSVASNGL